MLLTALLAGLLLAPQGEIRVAPQAVRERLVEMINADRAAAGLAPVEYSEELSRAADAHCREMLASGFTSHWNRDGWKPYLRYAAAGIRDNTSENIHSMWTTDFREDKLWDYVAEGHRGFMAEKPPDDGHRRSVLGEQHTHVGIGIAYDDHGLRMIELFGGRYAQLEALPLKARLKDRLFIKGRLRRASDRLLGISVFYEPLPQSLSRVQLQGTYSYALPTEERMERPRLEMGRYVDGTTGSVQVSGRDFAVPLRFWKERPGAYTIAVWVVAGNKPAFIGAMTSLLVEQ